jgi:hypothetical protein
MRDQPAALSGGSDAEKRTETDEGHGSPGVQRCDFLDRHFHLLFCMYRRAFGRRKLNLDRFIYALIPRGVLARPERRITGLITGISLRPTGP